MNLYREESSNAKWNAQRNLTGRTHYVDDDTLRFHHSRILSSGTTDAGLIFWLIESCSLDMHNTKRGFRHVAFDVFGTVIERTTLEDAYATKDAARKGLWKHLNSFNAHTHTLKEIDRQQAQFVRECDDMRKTVAKLGLSAIEAA